MLSIYDQGPFPPCPSPFNLAAHVLAKGCETPDKDALLVVSHETTERWSFAQVRQAVLGTAKGLVASGLQVGDVVLLRLGNTVDYPLAYLGALAAGMVPVPTSAALTEEETRFVIDTVKPAAVLRDPSVASAAHPVQITTEDLYIYRSLPPAAFHMGPADRLGYIIFTSGTSGKPRGVAHAHRAIWARQMMFDGWYGLSNNDRLLHAGAFNWTYTMGTGLMDPWTVGATAIIPAAGLPSAELPHLLARHEATIFAAAPGVYRQLLDQHNTLSLPSLRHGLSAGEKLPRATAHRWQTASGRPIYEAYGMSECSTFISQPPEGAPDAACLGTPQKGRRIALLADGEPVERGQEGTIAIAQDDPGLMLGYVGADQTIHPQLTGPWFLTGDQAVMDEDGAITYMGRADDMMNAGGYRVSPIEVENVLARFAAIDSVAVTEVTVKRDTSVIAAFYTAAQPLDDAALHDYVEGKLARYKQPRLFIHMPILPMGANGKILRRVLRDRYERPQ